jgi:hypothetical protein
MAEPGVIENLIAQAGLSLVASGDFAASLAFPDQDAAIRRVMSAAARAIRQSSDERVRATIRGTLAPFTRPDRSVVWNNRFRWVKARRAAPSQGPGEVGEDR